MLGSLSLIIVIDMITKKRLFIIILISSLIALSVVITFIIIRPKKVHSSSFDAIPIESQLIIDIKNYDEFTKNAKDNNLIYNKLDSLYFKIINTSSLLTIIDSIKLIPNLYSSFSPYHAVLSFEANEVMIEEALIFEINESIKDNKFYSDLQNYFSSQHSIKERKYKNHNILELELNNDVRVFIVIANNLFICSNNSLCIEKSINNIVDNINIHKKSSDFSKVYESAGKNESANIYININKVSILLRKFVSEDFYKTLQNLSPITNWLCLDLNILNDNINFNGVIYTNDSISNFATQLKTQKNIKINVLDILPENTAFYLVQAFNNLQFYINKADLSSNKDLKCLNTNTLTTIYQLIDNEICLAATLDNSNKSKFNFFTIAGIKSKSSTLSELEKLLPILNSCTGKTSNKSLIDYQEDITIDNKTVIPCYRLNIDNLPEILFGDIYSKSNSNYICLLDNFLIFAEDKTSIQQLVNNKILNKTLSTSLDHNAFLDNFSSSSLLFIYSSFHKFFNYISNYASTSIKNIISDNKPVLNQLGHLGIQITSMQDLLYCNIVLKHCTDAGQDIDTQWDIRLESSVSVGPFITTNHNDNSKEIIVQDSLNNLYLFNNIGREIWKLSIGEKITSNIYQIDLYKNGKLQYLFSTSNKIHLLDRLGNYVEQFPISLRSSSSSGISLFDYDNNKNYRIIVACVDNYVYLYDGYGKIVKGWNFDKTEKNIISDIVYYTYDREDYICFHDDYKLYILNRAGSSKIDFSNSYKLSNNKIWFDSKSSTPRFLTTSASGCILSFYINGKQDSLKLKEFSHNHFFLFEDIDGDGKKDYLFADSCSLEVYNINKKNILSFITASPISYEPFIFKTKDKQIKIGLVSKDENKIYLLNSDGSIFDGFPQFGSSKITIGSLSSANNRYNLLVGGLNNMLYNYEIKK